MEPVTLTTARLDLSLPTPSDVDAIYEACQDLDIQRYTTVPSPYARRDAEAFVARVAQQWSDGVAAIWAMRERDVLAGTIGLDRLDGRGAGEFGYWVSPASRRRGLLVEAARAVLDWSFSPAGLALQRIEWRAVVGNEGSARAARTLGFRYEGRLRAVLGAGNDRNDAWIAGLLATDDRTPQRWNVLGV